MHRLLNRLIAEDSGATAIEYCMLGALLALSIVAGGEAVGGLLGNIFDGVDVEVVGASSPP